MRVRAIRKRRRACVCGRAAKAGAGLRARFGRESLRRASDTSELSPADGCESRKNGRPVRGRPGPRLRPQRSRTGRETARKNVSYGFVQSLPVVGYRYRPGRGLVRVGRQGNPLSRYVRRTCRHLDRPYPSALRGKSGRPVEAYRFLFQFGHHRSAARAGLEAGRTVRQAGLPAFPVQFGSRGQRKCDEARFLRHRQKQGDRDERRFSRPHLAGRRGDRQSVDRGPGQPDGPCRVRPSQRRGGARGRFRGRGRFVGDYREYSGRRRRSDGRRRVRSQDPLAVRPLRRSVHRRRGPVRLRT